MGILFKSDIEICKDKIIELLKEHNCKLVDREYEAETEVLIADISSGRTLQLKEDI